jgi:predicted metal-dependent phosphoesterase TrpH
LIPTTTSKARDARLARFAAAVECLEATPAVADRLLSEIEQAAFQERDGILLARVWPELAKARRRRRARAAAGRIDLHTHTTASDGEMAIDELLCRHFVQGQILIDDHNIIDSLAKARQIVSERDLELDVFLGIEVICTRERRSFEFHAIAPRLSPEFTRLAAEHRRRWERASELFVAELASRDDLFELPAWRQIAEDFSVGGSFTPVVERYQLVRERIRGDATAYETYVRNNQTFDMGNLWRKWELGRPGDPPMLAHRFFGSMRCYAMGAYRDELGDWFDYDALALQFRAAGCFISHNHPNYWDEDFVGELPHELQTEWIRDWARRGIIDALEVWSPPFASKRVPHYWEKVCRELRLVPMAGTDCHSGKEQEYGGPVENHPEIPPMIYAKLAAPDVATARLERESWPTLSAWRKVLEVDYAQDEALTEVVAITRAVANV